MSDAKHTPGPWEARRAQAEGTALVPPGHGWGVAAVQPMRGRIDSSISGMTEANARLIAAAPELLEQLKLAKRAFANMLEFRIVTNEDKREAIRGIIERMEPAIAKAEGRA